MSTKNPTDGELPQISRILVATDFSAHARKALEWAQLLANPFRAKLVLLHVIDICSLAEIAPATAGLDPLYIFREQAHKCMRELKVLVPDAETIVREASPRPVIVAAAVELNCQMIVMGTHGRSGLAHILLGSVAEYVVRNSNVPVLTICTRDK